MSDEYKGMAVWVELPEKSTQKQIEQPQPQLQVHLNYWRLSQIVDAKRDDFLDLGLMLTHEQKGSIPTKAVIHLPFVINNDSVAGLGEIISADEIASAIFNRVLKSAQSQTNTYVEIYDDSPKHDKFRCRVYKLSKPNGKLANVQVGREHDATGCTSISIDLEKILRHEKTEQVTHHYVRLRLKVGSTKPSPFVGSIPPRYKWLKSVEESIEYLDFRLNDVRVLPPRISEEHNTASIAQLVRVDFFLVTGMEADIVGSAGPKIGRQRPLEPNLWSKYLENEKLEHSILTHHWKDNDKEHLEQGFDVFAKLRVKKSNLATLAKYFTLLMMVSIGINIICHALLKK